MLVMWDEENPVLKVFLPVAQDLYSTVHLVSSQGSMKATHLESLYSSSFPAKTESRSTWIIGGTGEGDFH